MLIQQGNGSAELQDKLEKRQLVIFSEHPRKTWTDDARLRKEKLSLFFSEILRES